MRRGVLVMVPAVLVGLAAALVVIAAHQGDTAFVYAQQHPTRIMPSQFEAILQTTREPVPTGAGSLAVSVRCIPGRTGPKLNPWHCTIRYRSGHAISYRIIVQPSGAFRGADRTGVRLVQGCCLQGGAVPSD